MALIDKFPVRFALVGRPEYWSSGKMKYRAKSLSENLVTDRNVRPTPKFSDRH
jgi:hypothetical protein